MSVLEGGYRIQGGIVSAFGRSVAGHVRALVDGCESRQASFCDTSLGLHSPEKRVWLVAVVVVVVGDIDDDAAPDPRLLCRRGCCCCLRYCCC